MSPPRTKPLGDPCVCVCVCLSGACVYTQRQQCTLCRLAPISCLRDVFFFFFRPHQRTRRESTRSAIVLLLPNYITQCHINYLYAICAQSRALSNSAPQLCQNEGWMTVTHPSDLSGTIKQMLPQDRQEASDHTSHCRPKAWTITAWEPVNVEQTL